MMIAHQSGPIETEDPGSQAGDRLSITFTPSPVGSLPGIGLGSASHRQPLSLRERALLRALNLHHLRLDLRLSEPDWVTDLHRVGEEALSLGAALELALHLSSSAEKELHSLACLISESKYPICAFLVFHTSEQVTSPRWIHLARRILEPAALSAVFVGGTDIYFAQLNRNRTRLTGVDQITFSINPQVHAFDNLSLMETLPIQAQVVESAKKFRAGLQVSVSPVTLKPRFQPNRSGPALESPAGALPAQVDVRQISLFGSAWTCGSIKYLAEAGASRVTFYETSGWRGVLEQEQGSPLPEHFPSIPGCVFPLYHILADIGEFAGGQVLPASSSCPDRVAVLALHAGNRTAVWAANLSCSFQEVVLQGLPPSVKVRFLDETTAEFAMKSPGEFRTQACYLRTTSEGRLILPLLPYALVRVDCLN